LLFLPPPPGFLWLRALLKSRTLPRVGDTTQVEKTFFFYILLPTGAVYLTPPQQCCWGCFFFFFRGLLGFFGHPKTPRGSSSPAGAAKGRCFLCGQFFSGGAVGGAPHINLVRFFPLGHPFFFPRGGVPFFPVFPKNPRRPAARVGKQKKNTPHPKKQRAGLFLFFGVFTPFWKNKKPKHLPPPPTKQKTQPKHCCPPFSPPPCFQKLPCFWTHVFLPETPPPPPKPQPTAPFSSNPLSKKKTLPFFFPFFFFIFPSAPFSPLPLVWGVFFLWLCG